RGNFPVFRKNLSQWMMRITAYADRLLDDLELLDWTEKVKSMQRNWIGRSRGAEVTFDAQGHDIKIFTTRPDTLFGAEYMVWHRSMSWSRNWPALKTTARISTPSGPMARPI